IKVTWKQDGKEVVREERVPVRAGDKVELDLTKPRAPSPPPDPVGKFELPDPLPEVTVPAGGKAAVAVPGLRKDFAGPVRPSLVGAPAGVTAAEVTVPGSAREGQLEVRAAPTAAAGSATAFLVARAGEKEVRARLRILVTAPAPQPAVLKVAKVPA